jgi:hypothetical protein
MRHLRSRGLALRLVLALSSHAAKAQRLAPRAMTSASPRSSSAARDTLPAQDAHSETYYVVRDGGIGGAVGIATGLLTATMLTHRSSVRDHSEDGFAYAMPSLVGGVVGFLIGAIVGSLSHRVVRSRHGRVAIAAPLASAGRARYATLTIQRERGYGSRCNTGAAPPL